MKPALKRVYVACTALCAAILMAMAFLIAHGIALDGALPPAAEDDPSAFVGETADYLLDFGEIGVVDADTLPGILARMTPNEDRMPAVGHQIYTGGKLWLHFSVPSMDTDQDRWAIRLGNTRVREARLVVIRGSDLFERRWSYDSPERRAGLSTRVPIFHFDRAEIEGAKVLLGFNSAGAMRANVTLETARASASTEMWQAVKFGLLVGFLTALAIYLVVIGARLGERALMFAGGLCFFAGTFIFGVGGYIHTVVLAPWPRLADVLLYGTQPVMMTFWMLLAITYLDLSRRAPALAGALLAVAMLLPFQGVLTMFTAFGYPIPFITDNATPVLVGILAGMAPVIFYSARGDRRAIQLLACFAPVAITSLIRVYLYLAPSSHPYWVGLFESFVDIVATMTLLSVLIVLDIRNRETALRMEARRNEERFRQYAEIASDSYFETDAAGRITGAAGRVTRELGLVEGGDLTGVLRAHADGDAEAALAPFRRALDRREGLREVEVAARTADGGLGWLSFNVVPLAAEGGGLRGTITDVTERVERRRREARQNTLSALGQLASGVAHEVNNLLHPMVNLAQRVRDKHTSDEEARKLLDLVVASGKHAGEIVAGVLNSFNPARPPGARQPVEEALDAALRTVHATLPATVQLTISLAGGTGARAPAGEMLQLVSNLISNAIRAMDGVGRIDVTLAPFEGGARLTFRDDGPGMPEHIRRRATEPFVTGRNEGTGLGLSVVANIVRNWRGELDIRSMPGAGTAIIITLPAERI